MKKETIKKQILDWYYSQNNSINITRDIEMSLEVSKEISDHAYIQYDGYYIWGRIIYYSSLNCWYYLAQFVVDVLNYIDSYKLINKKILTNIINKVEKDYFDSEDEVINDYIKSCKKDEEFDYQAFEEDGYEYLEENYDYGYSTAAEDYFEYRGFMYILDEYIYDLKELIESKGE